MTPTREEIVEVIREMSQLHPDWRFGQMIANLSFMARGPAVESIWDVEDEEFLSAAREYVERRKGILSGGRREALK